MKKLKSRIANLVAFLAKKPTGTIKVKINTCPTIHILDLPKEEDLFGKGHQKIADAIAQIILTTYPGHAIGIEGSWGSGKSTIVRLLEIFSETMENIVSYYLILGLMKEIR